MKTYNTSIQPVTTLNANFNSAAKQVYEMYGFSIQAAWTGTPTGTFELQVSSDPVQLGGSTLGTPQPTNWTVYTGSSYAVSASGNYMWNVFDVMFNWVRLVYTDSSGGTSTAVLTSAIINGKGW